jgi:zinc protease
MTLSSYVAGAPEGYLRDRVRTIESLSDADLEQAAGLLRDALGRARATWVRPGAKEGRIEWAPGKGGALEAARVAPARHLTQVLPNGLTVSVERSDDSAVFAMHVLLRPRAASEPAGKEGIADFLHRLYPKGTSVRDAAALDAAMAALGASIKVHDEDGIPYDDYYTTPEFSWVRLEMPADRWREGVALVAEMVVHPRLAPDDVEAVRREMLDLLSREAASPSAVARGLLAAQLAPGHPQSSAVLGSSASIASITVEDLRAFHAAYVTGRRTIVTASGPVDPATVVRAVAESFGGLGAGADLPVVAPPPVTPPGRHAEATLGKEQAYLALGYLFDAEAKDRAALEVAGAMLSDRLSFTLREERGLAYSMGASFGPWAGRTRFVAVMGTRPENVDAALQGLLEGLQAFRDAAIDDAAVERAANALRGRTIMRRMTRVNLAYFAGIERMENRPQGDDVESLEALLGVSAEDVRRVVERYLKPGSCAVVVVR